MGRNATRRGVGKGNGRGKIKDKYASDENEHGEKKELKDHRFYLGTAQSSEFQNYGLHHQSYQERRRLRGDIAKALKNPIFRSTDASNKFRVRTHQITKNSHTKQTFPKRML